MTDLASHGDARRKFVFVFDVPLVNKDGIASEEDAKTVSRYCENVLDWHLEDWYNAAPTVKVQVGAEEHNRMTQDEQTA